MKRMLLLFLMLLLIVLPVMAADWQIPSGETVLTETAWIQGYGTPLPDGWRSAEPVTYCVSNDEMPTSGTFYDMDVLVSDPELMNSLGDLESAELDTEYGSHGTVSSTQDGWRPEVANKNRFVQKEAGRPLNCQMLDTI